MEYLQDALKQIQGQFHNVGPLNRLEFALNNITLVRLDSSFVHITMTETTLRRIFEFDG